VKPLALSTMYAQQERFEDGAVFARFAADAGFDAIEISHSTPAAKIEAIARAGILPVTSFHAPAPYVKRANGRGNSSANLAAVDPDERKAAVDYTLLSIDWAARLGARALVVHLGQVSDVHEQFEDELAMRRMFDSGMVDEERFSEFRERVIQRRAAEAEPYLVAARQSLEALIQKAEQARIVIGLENRYHYHEIPAPDEYEQLFDGFAIEQVGYWHDVGHAEVLDRLGLVGKRRWLDRWSGRIVGAHLHDVSGIGDHRSPGDGDVDWEYIVAGVAGLAGYTLEINQRQPAEAVAAAPRFLASIGLR